MYTCIIQSVYFS